MLSDPDSARGEGQHAIDWFVPSPEGRYVACAVSPSGSENSKLQVIDVDGGVILDDIIPPLTASTAAPTGTASAPTRGRTWWSWHEGSTRGSS